MLSFRQKLQRQEGFTLIELLIVIIILGILAAIVIFGVTTFRDDANEKACKSDRKSVEIAAQAYLAKTGSAATDYSDLVPTYLKNEPDGTYGSKSFTFAEGVANSGGC